MSAGPGTGAWRRRATFRPRDLPLCALSAMPLSAPALPPPSNLHSSQSHVPPREVPSRPPIHRPPLALRWSAGPGELRTPERRSPRGTGAPQGPAPRLRRTRARCRLGQPPRGGGGGRRWRAAARTAKAPAGVRVAGRAPGAPLLAGRAPGAPLLAASSRLHPSPMPSPLSPIPPPPPHRCRPSGLRLPPVLLQPAFIRPVRVARAFAAGVHPVSACRPCPSPTGHPPRPALSAVLIRPSRRVLPSPIPVKGHLARACPRPRGECRACGGPGAGRPRPGTCAGSGGGGARSCLPAHSLCALLMPAAWVCVFGRRGREGHVRAEAGGRAGLGPGKGRCRGGGDAHRALTPRVRRP
ncbi:hypothetical protein HNP84_009485 [Thermocatellispora tengchongensis]|uniref:Uncharacterized protein n=1 Tax=Thermocatellispora tengchongensis TaxID=1073253 RepID=A0A840PPL8_9ACTN|nr:hypothetical protein [Thermocatellispora tengchongensis]